MPKISRTCRTPGCLQENQPVVTGMRECIHCGRAMSVPEPTAPASEHVVIVSGLAGLSEWYFGYPDEGE